MQNRIVNPTLMRDMVQNAEWSREGSVSPWRQYPQQTKCGNRPLKVVMVAACPLPSPRGTPIRILRMAEALCERGHDVHIVTYHLGAPEVHPQLKMHRTFPLRWYRDEAPGPTWTKFLVMDPLLVMKLRGLLTRFDPDVIHAHHYEGLIVAKMALGRRKIPLIYDAHTMLDSELPLYGFVGSAWLSKKIGACIDRRLPPMADHVIAVTQTIRDRFVKSGIISPDSITVVTNGVEPEMFGVPNAVEGTPELGRNVVFTGNVAGYQGLDLLLKAFRTVIDRSTDARLVIATEKEFSAFEPIEKQACEFGVRENVDFVVINGLKHLRELLARADVAVNPRTKCDGIPQKLLNYMAAGKAVVSFEGSGAIIHNGITGITVPNGNVVGFGENIIDLFKNYRLRQQLGKNAREYIKENLSWEKVATTVEKINFGLITDHSLGDRMKV